MAKIKIAVAGCLGRMGQEISKQILKNKKELLQHINFLNKNDCKY